MSAWLAIRIGLMLAVALIVLDHVQQIARWVDTIEQVYQMAREAPAAVANRLPLIDAAVQANVDGHS